MKIKKIIFILMIVLFYIAYTACSTNSISAYENSRFKIGEKAVFQGLFTHTEPRLGLDEQIESVKQVLDNNPYISGITIKLAWKHFHPEKDKINMDKLEELVSIIASRNKLIHLGLMVGIDAPDWIYKEGVTRIGPVKALNSEFYVPLVWDEKYIKLLSNDLKIIAKKYARDPRISAIQIMGHNYIGEEMHASASLIKDLEPYGYSVEKVTENWKYWIDFYGKTFPDKNLILVISQMYGGDMKVPEVLVEYFVKKYQGRAILQTDQLNGREESTLESKQLCEKFNKYAPNGHEMVASFKEQEDGSNVGMNQGTVEMTVYNFINMGNPLYLQLWRRDCDDPKYAKALLDAWNLYKHYQPVELKVQMTRDGVFVEKYDGRKFAVTQGKKEGKEGEVPSRDKVLEMALDQEKRISALTDNELKDKLMKLWEEGKQAFFSGNIEKTYELTMEIEKQLK